MRPLLEWCSAVALSRFAIIIPIAIGVVGCSDSSRFNDPFANPYASRGAGPEVTSSVPPPQAAPVGRVDAQPLGAQPMPPPGPTGPPAYYGPGPGNYGSAQGNYGSGPGNYGSGPGTPPGMGPQYGPQGPAYAPRASDYPPRDYPPRTADYPGPSYPPRGIGPEYQPRGAEYPQQAPNYPPQGAEYPPRPPDYPPRGPDYSPRGPDYPPRPDTTGAVSGPPDRAIARSNWGAGGGSVITVGPGDTINGIAKRYGVSSAALMAANHISAPATIRRGQQIVIPHTPATAVAGSGSTPPSSQMPPPTTAIAHPPAAPASGGGEGIHVVAAGETLSSIAHHYRRSRTIIAKANNIEPDAKLHIAQRLIIPGGRSTTAHIGGLEPTTPARPPASQGGVAPAVAQAADPGSPASPPAAQKVVAAAPAGSARITTATTSEPLGEDVTSDKAGQASAAVPQFRWPVHGRIISGFGPKAAGQPNDGINVAVPEGTAVKAADDGIVAYAGNELKGYGNLILVRHQNGFVTAYANASELMVRRGDTVKRGQVIARSGQTGTVTSPQLHFEIRKGATPVDPTQYLAGT
jgi:murein DD-endopeptidase MepM/ murein hydrolase activator NlpD